MGCPQASSVDSCRGIRSGPAICLDCSSGLPVHRKTYAARLVFGRVKYVSRDGTSRRTGDARRERLGIKSTDALFVAVARSRTVEDGIIAHFDLQRVYRAHYIDQARKRLETNTEIADDKKSGIVTITVTDHDPIRARDMAQAYVELLDQTLRTASTSSARREREFLEGRLAAVKGELADATARLSRFSSDTNTIDIKEQGKSTVDVVAMLQGQLMAAQTPTWGTAGDLYG